MKKFSTYLLMGMVCLHLYAGDGKNYVSSDIRSTLQQGDKVALVMVHFGSTYDDTRQKTIEAINQQAAQTFPEFSVAEAFTSRIVIRRLKERGIVKQTPLEVMNRLAEEGYTHLILQSSNIIEGVEMESLRKDMEAVQSKFKEVRVGNPLLYEVNDFERVVEILGKEIPEKGTLVLVGHGTYTPTTATYSMLEYMAHDKGYNRLHIGTIEGYPSMDELVRRLREDGETEVTLLPFMFVAGDHANNDIAVEWKEALEKEGFKVNVRMEGLGENPEIQQLFIDHARFSSLHKVRDIMTKKKEYAAGKDVDD